MDSRDALDSTRNRRFIERRRGGPGDTRSDHDGQSPFEFRGTGAKRFAGTLDPKLGGGGRTSHPDSRRLVSDAHSRGSFLWAPPPVAAAAAVEQLCDVVHKRPCCRHVFVCPLIMTYLWRKQLLKACAFRFTMKSVIDIWHYTEHEPLGFFIVPPSADMNPGTYGLPSQWWTWRLPCVKCQKMTTYRRGILCVNSFCSREGWRACQKAWCA
jgi:hypothetical protein